MSAVAPLGRFYPDDRCRLCGLHLDKGKELMIVVVAETQARALECRAILECAERARQLRLFNGRAA